MKTKNIIAMLIVCLFVGISASSFASEKENRDITNEFSRVSVTDGINLFLSQGNAPSISLEANEDIFNKIETVVQDETLIIRVKKGEKLRGQTIIAHVTMPAIDEIKADKKANVYLQTPIFTTANLGVYINNSSSIACGAINAKELSFSINNSSKCQLSTIVSEIFTLNVVGYGKVQEGEVNTDFATVNLYNNSTASISVNATTLVSSAYKESDLTIGGTTNNITANASDGSYIRGNNLNFEKSTVKSLSGSSVKLAQK